MAERDWGGEAESVTVTEVCAVEAPLLLVAVKVYTVVEVGLTFVDPIRALVLKEPGVMDNKDASLTFQDRVEVPPEETEVGEAEKEDMAGWRLSGVTLLAGEEDAEVPAAFLAVTVKV